jgi:methylmalonyl-CoA mutase cobalamin-binding subunit
MWWWAALFRRRIMNFYTNCGVAKVFGPGTIITESANQVLNLLEHPDAS